ncbi:MAG: hypothetical protein ABIQ89_02180 [Candidatus Saccharimonadales bacterium]
MYSGTTFSKHSGNLLGAHQKFDRVARRHLEDLLADKNTFPRSRTILQFEGKNGPDGIKRKSPAKDEPWHYYNPFDDDDSKLIGLITDHYKSLVKELKSNNKERSAFEASWLAHAIVDGLTPAHHYPYEEKLIELRGGEGLETRTTVKSKLVIPGETKRAQVKNNWKMWGPRGLFTSHGLFEMGIAAIVKPVGFGDAVPKQQDLDTIIEIGIAEQFKRSAREIAVMGLFDTYRKTGWTPKLARQIRQKLGPIIIQNITLAWYAAAAEAKLVKGQ